MAWLVRVIPQRTSRMERSSLMPLPVAPQPSSFERGRSVDTSAYPRAKLAQAVCELARSLPRFEHAFPGLARSFPGLARFARKRLFHGTGKTSETSVAGKTSETWEGAGREGCSLICSKRARPRSYQPRTKKKIDDDFRLQLCTTYVERRKKQEKEGAPTGNRPCVP